MDPAIQRALNDKLYDKRKVGALEWVTLVTLQLLLSPLKPARATYPGCKHPFWDSWPNPDAPVTD